MSSFAKKIIIVDCVIGFIFIFARDIFVKPIIFVMGFSDFFKSKEERAKLAHLKHLVILAMADGRLEKSELASIAAVCAREGISESELKRCIEDPDSIDFAMPTDESTKLRYIKDLVLLMMSDGDIDEKEILWCKIVAEKLGYRHEVTDAMVLNIIADIRATYGE